MKDIDPDVQALLDENPVTLPDPLVRQGWGQHTMRDTGRTTKHPSVVTQPIFDTICVQCQRPVTIGQHGRYTDHAGQWFCPADMVDERQSEYHQSESDYEVLVALRKPAVQLKIKCSAQKHDFNHSHQCFHPLDHFGFHECSVCRRLWR